jgi:hypothetical protein
MYGFKISRYALDNLYSRDEQLFEKFLESDYAFAVDAWRPDTSEYVFGLLIDAIPSGHIHLLYADMVYDRTSYLEMTGEFQEYFPDLAENCFPHIYILSCID